MNITLKSTREHLSNFLCHRMSWKIISVIFYIYRTELFQKKVCNLAFFVKYKTLSWKRNWFLHDHTIRWMEYKFWVDEFLVFRRVPAQKMLAQILLCDINGCLCSVLEPVTASNSLAYSHSCCIVMCCHMLVNIGAANSVVNQTWIPFMPRTVGWVWIFHSSVASLYIPAGVSSSGAFFSILRSF